MALGNYIPEKVQLIVGGAIISGYVDGTFINVERANDTFSMRAGADGEVSRAKRGDKTGTVTITLLDTSNSNPILSAFHNLDEETGNGIIPILIKDDSGTTLIESAESWVRKPAVVELSNENTAREWMIDCAVLNILVGSN